MRPVAAAVRAVLHQLEPVGVVTPVLAGDVVTVLALLAGQGDLGPHIGGSHSGVPFSRNTDLSERWACGSGPSNIQRRAGKTSSRRAGSCNTPATAPAGGSRGSPPWAHTAGQSAAAAAA